MKPQPPSHASSARGSPRPFSPSVSSPAPGSAAGSATQQSSNTTVDVYRPLANQVKKPLTPYLPLPSTSTSLTSADLPSVLGVSSTTFNSRVLGKAVLLTDVPTSGSAAAGSKPGSRLGTPGPGPWGESAEAGPSKLRVQARRKGKEKQEGKGATVVGSKTRIDYATLLPLHYMHSTYLIQLLSLPLSPLASLTPTATTTSSHRPPPPSPLPLSPESIQAKLVKADLTGARLRVRSARNESLVGIEGIVIEETAGSFRVVPRSSRGAEIGMIGGSRVRVVPKVGSLVTISFPAYAPRPTKIANVYNGLGGRADPAPIDGMEVDVDSPDDATPDLTAAAAADDDDDDGWIDWPNHDLTCPRIEIDILGSSFAFRSADRAGRRFKQAQGDPGNGWGEDWVQGDWEGLLGSTTHRWREDGKGESGTRSKKGTTKTIKGEERVTAQSRAGGRRKKSKSRRKDPLVGGTLIAH